MGTAFWIVTFLFMLVALAMVLIILVQRPQGGGLAGAFGGAGGSSTDTVFGGRVGDALTVATVVAFALYLGLAIALNLLDNVATGGATAATPAVQAGPGDVPVDTTIPDFDTTFPPIDPDTAPPPSTDDSTTGNVDDPNQSTDTTDDDGER